VAKLVLGNTQFLDFLSPFLRGQSIPQQAQSFAIKDFALSPVRQYKRLPLLAKLKFALATLPNTTAVAGKESHLVPPICYCGLR
jgi:hypothetical protein